MKAAGKRDDVTALLLYTKGQQMLEPEQYERLKDEMAKLDIDVALRGATCTLSKTSDVLEKDSGTVFKMYAALAAVPTAIGLVPYLGAAVFGLDLPPAFGLGFAATFGLAITAKIVIHQPAERGDPHWAVPLLRDRDQAVLRRRRARRDHHVQVPGVRHRVGVGPRGAQNQGERWPEKRVKGRVGRERADSISGGGMNIF